MQDRVPLYPGRVTLTPVEGQENTYDMVRADQPTQIGTALSKANLLKDDTAAQFGLDSSAVPNDILNWLGKYNEYWWSASSTSTTYLTALTSVSVNTTMISAGSGTRNIYYSKTFTIDSDGTVTLTDPVTLTFKNGSSNSSQCNELVANAPCYITNISYNTDAIYYLPEGSTTGSTSSHTIYYNTAIYISGSASYRAKTLVVTPVYTGEPIYVHSTDRNAYPDSGTVDGITYTYLGVPFESMPIISLKANFEKGSYTGTGTSGANAQNELIFSFPPKVVLIFQSGGEVITLFAQGNTYATTSSTSNSSDCALSWSGNSVSWYYTSSNTLADQPTAQLNKKNTIYHYFAIG